jgi:hypothetical protein
MSCLDEHRRWVFEQASLAVSLIIPVDVVRAFGVQILLFIQ